MVRIIDTTAVDPDGIRNHLHPTHGNPQQLQLPDTHLQPHGVKFLPVAHHNGNDTLYQCQGVYATDVSYRILYVYFPHIPEPQVKRLDVLCFPVSVDGESGFCKGTISCACSMVIVYFEILFSQCQDLCSIVARSFYTLLVYLTMAYYERGVLQDKHPFLTIMAILSFM